jgi:hypothetical protein
MLQYLLYTDKAKQSRLLAGKMPRGHLLSTWIIVVSILMYCNFDHEDVVSSKLNALLRRATTCITLK